MTDTAVERQVKEKPPGYVFGRPTKYRPEFCERVIELGKQGYSQAQMAADLDVSKGLLTQWCKEHPDFLNALSRARTHAQAWWEREAQEGLKNRDFNAGLWDKSVKSRFRDDYQDRSTVEHVGKDDGPIEIKDDLSAARKIAFMLGRAVGKQQARKADEPQS